MCLMKHMTHMKHCNIGEIQYFCWAGNIGIIYYYNNYIII